MVNTNDLQAYYDSRLREFKSNLETELQKFKDCNNNYLSSVIADACEHAKMLLESSNQKAFERFTKSQEDIDIKMKENYPETILVYIIKSTKDDLDSSLKFNQSLFDGSVSFYKNLLKD